MISMAQRQITSYIVRLFLLLTLTATGTANAEVVADWGTISTPLEEDVIFSVERSDITKNFTDEYIFTLEGSADAIYEVTFNFDYCSYGCGNVATSYGVYDANGGLITDVSTSGTVILTSGDYSFQVKGTGFGAGNSIDYQGQITFSAVAAIQTSTMISSAPEPSTYFLLVCGIVVTVISRSSRRRHWGKFITLTASGAQA